MRRDPELKERGWCGMRYCQAPSGKYHLCLEHRAYMRVAKARGILAKKSGVKRSQVSQEVATLYAILQMGSPYSHE